MIGVAPVTGATNPVTVADVIDIDGGTEVVGYITTNVRVFPEPVPDTMPTLAVPASTVGVKDDENV